MVRVVLVVCSANEENRSWWACSRLTFACFHQPFLIKLTVSCDMGLRVVIHLSGGGKTEVTHEAYTPTSRRLIWEGKKTVAMFRWLRGSILVKVDAAAVAAACTKHWAGRGRVYYGVLFRVFGSRNDIMRLEKYQSKTLLWRRI